MDRLTERFERERPRLRAVAYRMLGSTGEAEDAVQEAWLRLNRTDANEIDNLGAWLTTVVGRIALNMLRSRRTRREEPLDDLDVEQAGAAGPEDDAVLADSVGLALVVVLETLTPPERLAYVLHDMFAEPFDDIAAILGRSPEAARQLASRGRRRVRGLSPRADADPAAEQAVVDAFLAASHEGDFEALVAVLDPDVVLTAVTADEPPVVVRGAEAVAGRARAYGRIGLVVRSALVDGAPGWVSMLEGEIFSAAAITVRSGKIVQMAFLADPARLAELEIVLR